MVYKMVKGLGLLTTILAWQVQQVCAAQERLWERSSALAHLWWCLWELAKTTLYFVHGSIQHHFRVHKRSTRSFHDIAATWTLCAKTDGWRKAPGSSRFDFNNLRTKLKHLLRHIIKMLSSWCRTMHSLVRLVVNQPHCFYIGCLVCIYLSVCNQLRAC